MHCRLILAAGCLTSLMLAGCGGGAVHIVERTGPDVSSQSAQLPSSRAADAAQRSDQAPPPSPPEINTPPDFPPNYRTRIAVYLALEYLRDGKGPPEISDLQTSANPIAGRTSVCVQFPFAGTMMRRILIYGARGVFSLGQVSFKRTNLDFFVSCPGEMKPFVELEQVAQKLMACRAKGERRCVVNDEPNRRDILVIPVNSS
jgi:hypothetical protein